MDKAQELTKAQDLVKSLDAKRTDLIGFIAAEMKKNPRLEKALSDLNILNSALEKANTAVTDLNKAIKDEEDLKKAQEEEAAKAAEELKKAEEEAAKKAEEEAAAKAAEEEAAKKAEEEEMNKAKDLLKNEICEAMRANKEFTDEYVKELADKFKISAEEVEDMMAEAIDANGGAEA